MNIQSVNNYQTNSVAFGGILNRGAQKVAQEVQDTASKIAEDLTKKLEEALAQNAVLKGENANLTEQNKNLSQQLQGVLAKASGEGETFKVKNAELTDSLSAKQNQALNEAAELRTKLQEAKRINDGLENENSYLKQELGKKTIKPIDPKKFVAPDEILAIVNKLQADEKTIDEAFLKYLTTGDADAEKIVFDYARNMGLVRKSLNDGTFKTLPGELKTYMKNITQGFVPPGNMWNDCASGYVTNRALKAIDGHPLSGSREWLREVYRNIMALNDEVSKQQLCGPTYRNNLDVFQGMLETGKKYRS